MAASQLSRADRDGGVKALGAGTAFPWPAGLPKVKVHVGVFFSSALGDFRAA